jgi:lysozyme
MTVSFADLSHHQATVDLAAYARAGHDRVVLKATQGVAGIERYVDPTFAARWRVAGQLGLARGAYHFAETEGTGAAEWTFFAGVVRAAGGFGPRDFAVLDAEDNDSATAIRRADEFCAEFTDAAAADHCPTGLLYTGRWYAEPTNLRPDDLQPGWRRLWLADYTPGQPDTQAELPAGWTPAQLAGRQHTDQANVAGITGGCDYSRVINDWLGSRPPEEDDMTPDEAKAAFREVLQGRFAPGEATVREMLQQWPTVRAAIAGLSDDEAKILAAVRAGDNAIDAAITKVATGQPVTDPAVFARAVIAELGTELTRGTPA